MIIIASGKCKGHWSMAARCVMLQSRISIVSDLVGIEMGRSIAWPVKQRELIKFVIDSPADCREVENWLTEHPQARRDRVLLMPQGIDPAVLAHTTVWLEPFCRQHGFQLCPRRHIEWYGARRGT